MLLQSRWIPASEALPPDGAPVLALLSIPPAGHLPLVARRHAGEWWAHWPVRKLVDEVTHWCELPKAPEALAGEDESPAEVPLPTPGPSLPAKLTGHMRAPVVPIEEE